MAKSSTSTGVTPLITTYSNSKEASDLAIQFKNVIAANVVGGVGTSLDLDDGDITIASIVTGDPSDPTDPTNPTDKIEIPVVKSAPLLSDIELISKIVEYDATGTPSIKITFKVRNSSGQSVKSVNARVQV